MTSTINYERPIWNGCTPLNVAGNRFLRWNSHGIITQYTKSDEDKESDDDGDNPKMIKNCKTSQSENWINVKFHDTSVHHEIQFENHHQRFVLADLSRKAVALANVKLLHVNHFDPLYEETEWSLEMPRGEHTKVVCLADEFVALATDRRMVRLFSLEGIQHSPICLPGPVHAMAATGNTIAIVYRRQLPLPESHSLEMMLLQVNPIHVPPIQQMTFSPIKLSLTNGSTLEWLGFSDEGTVTIYDSSGSVRLLKNGLGGNWIEVANLKVDTHSSDHRTVTNHFMISLSDLHEQIRCVPCYGSRFPNTQNPPLMQIKPFRLAFCSSGKEMDGQEKQELENNYQLANIRHSLINSMLERQNVHQEYKDSLKAQADSLFKLFLYGCKQERESLSLDAARLIPSLKTKESLLQFADQNKLERLVPRLAKVIEEDGQTPPETIRHVFISTFPKDNKVRLGNNEDHPDLELRPLQYIPELDETKEKIENKRQESDSGRRSLANGNKNVIRSNESKTEIESDSLDDESSNDCLAKQSHRSRMALLESSLFGNEAVANQVLEMNTELKNPFKMNHADKSTLLKRKLQIGDILNKKKKV